MQPYSGLLSSERVSHPLVTAATVGEQDAESLEETSAGPPARAALEAITPAIWRVLRRTGVLPGEIEDAVQSILVQLCRRWSDLHELPLDELRAYACCAASGVAVDLARRRGRDSARLTSLDAEPVDHGPGPEDALARKRALASLDLILLAMPEDRRIAFVLYEIEELPAPQIAEHLGIPLGTVASRLRKARQDFERAVGKMRAAHGNGGTLR